MTYMKKDILIKKIIEVTLQKDDRLWNKEKTELNQTLLFDLLDKIDEKIIDLLLREKSLREKFFAKIRDVYVFKTNEFKFFMEENKIDNSFTQYKNRIGLTDGKRFLKDTNDVVLDFPYKDCVLEGGQSTEEGTDTYFEYSDKEKKYEEKKAKRKEIFYNQILAQDEIDRLFDPKAFVNWKRYTKNKEEKVKEINHDENGTIKENLIIKGNNLLALHSLKKHFAGKIKLIYIDPPYNTEGAANTFVYNNSFNHASWLTFIKNRIDCSKTLLNDNGIFAIAIDHAELLYVGVMLDELFGKTNRLGIIAIETNPRGRSDSTFFATSHEYMLVYALNSYSAKINNLPLTEKQAANFNLEDSISSYRLLPFRRSGSNSTPKERPNLFYEIYFNETTEEISLKEQKGFIKIIPKDNDGNQRVWRQGKTAFSNALKNNDIVIKRNSNDKFSVYLKDRIKQGRKPKTFWSNPKYDASSHGTIYLKKLFGDKVFSYPKSIFLMRDILQILTDDNDIIVDYNAGSGTTAHALLALNKEDGGNRKFILVEQMDYINSVTVPRVQKVMEKENIDDSFIYFELAKWNEKAKEEILACNSLEELEKLFDKLYEKYFLNYNLKIKEFKEKVSKEEDFRNLSLEVQKKMFLAMLDLNQMYVNKTEMADKKYGINKEDQKLTEEFYKD